MTDPIPVRPPRPVEVLDPTLPRVEVAEGEPGTPFACTPLVWAFDPWGDAERPLVLRDGAYVTVPRRLVPRGLLDPGPNPPEVADDATVFYIPDGERSDGATLTRLGMVLGGVRNLAANLLALGFWPHDFLLRSIAEGLDLPRAAADEVAYLGWLSTPGLDRQQARDCYAAVSANSATKTGGLGRLVDGVGRAARSPIGRTAIAMGLARLKALGLRLLRRAL